MITLRKHQKESVRFLSRRDRALDFSDPGTGKTGVHITDFANRRKKGGGCALVLAPKSLLVCAWADDVHKFAPHLKTSVAFAHNREKAFSQPADMYITNTDAAVWLAKKPTKFFKGFDQLIIDESTAYKHRTSARSKAIAKIRDKFRVRRILTGTPYTRTITDLWHQAYIVDDGKRLGSSFFAFRAATCTPTQIGPRPEHVEWQDKPGAESAVFSLLNDITIRHKLENCTDIPPNHRYSVFYELSQRHAAHYAELEASSLLELKTGTISAINGAVLYNKLLQVASGASYADVDGAGEYVLLDSGRYELITDLVDARAHSIVFFNWRHQRDLLAKAFADRGITFEIIDGSVTRKGARERVVKNYQAGMYRTLLAHPQSAGHGLTLTRGTASIFASPTANLEHFLQAMKRIYRISQTQCTETIMVTARGTLEERVIAKLDDRNLKQSNLLTLFEAA